MDKHMGITGTREKLTEYQYSELFKFLYTGIFHRGFTHFHHGDCKGADAIAAHFAIGLGYKIGCHPPNNPKFRAFVRPGHKQYPEKDYMTRNQDIVNASIELIAVPNGHEEQVRSGTWSTVRKARAKDIPIHMIYPKPDND